jgi:hypothetical protein
MQPCEGNCMYGDELYGCNPLTYDGSKCGCVRCPNFQICHVWAPPLVFDCHSGRCGNCNASFGKDLVFHNDVGSDEDCPVCMDVTTELVEYPTGCGHKVCVGCLRESFWPQNPSSIPYALFGYENECVCECCEDCADGYVCTPEMNRWETEFPDQYAAWTAAEDAQDMAFDRKISERADHKKCPLCRAHICDAPGNSWHMGLFNV